MDNSTRRILLDKIKSSGYPGSVLDVYAAYDQGIDLVQDFINQQMQAQGQQSQQQLQQPQQPQDQGQMQQPMQQMQQPSEPVPTQPPGVNLPTMQTPQENYVDSAGKTSIGLTNIPETRSAEMINNPAKMQMGGSYQTNQEISMYEWNSGRPKQYLKGGLRTKAINRFAKGGPGKPTAKIDFGKGVGVMPVDINSQLYRDIYPNLMSSGVDPTTGQSTMYGTPMEKITVVEDSPQHIKDFKQYKQEYLNKDRSAFRDWYDSLGYNTKSVNDRAERYGYDKASKELLEKGVENLTEGQKAFISKSAYANKLEPGIFQRFQKAFTNPGFNWETLGNLSAPLEYTSNLVRGIMTGDVMAGLRGEPTNEYFRTDNMPAGYNPQELSIANNVFTVATDPLAEMVALEEAPIRLMSAGSKGVGNVTRGVKNFLPKTYTLDPIKNSESIANRIFNQSSSLLPEGVTKLDIQDAVKKNLDWVTSEEYMARRMASTGETREQVQKSINQWVKELDKNVKFTFSPSNTDTEGFYRNIPGLFSNSGRIEVSNNLSADEFLGTLDHEIAHSLSPTGRKQKLYKSYPRLIQSIKEKKLFQNPFTKKSAKDLEKEYTNYLAKPEEQQVRGIRLNHKIRQDLGLPQESPISREQFDNWLDTHYNPDIESFNKSGFADVSNLLNEAIDQSGKNVRSDLYNWLNKAWAAVPIAGGVGLKVLNGQEETPKQKLGGFTKMLYNKPKYKK